MTAGARNLYIHIEDCHDTYGPACVREAIREYEANYRQAVSASAVARAHEPNHGWGTRTIIGDAWADGFRTACVEISDKLLATPPDTTPGE